MEALAQETGEVAIEPENLKKAATKKKKVRVVKKIVKKVIKRVPKRVEIAPICNNLHNISTPNPNENPHIKIENPKPVVDELKEKVENVKERTKIFIYGLVEGTKEEDVKKVVEEVGEVVEVKLITDFKTGKSRGCGFVRYASSDFASLALIKYHNVEICGTLCHTAAIEGNDIILLNNIDKKWKNEDVVELLRKMDIKNLYEVLVVRDPDNIELNRGLVFVEFETKRDAQMAYNKLQNKNVFGKQSYIKASWAKPFVDPVEEEMHKSHLKDSLLKSIPKVKPTKTLLESGVNEVSKFNRKSGQSRPYEGRYQKGSQSRQSQQHAPFLSVYKPPQKPKNMIGMSVGHHQPPYGGNQPFAVLGSRSLYHHDNRAYHQTHLQIPNAAHPRPIANMASFVHHQQQGLFQSGSFIFVTPDPRYFQIRDNTTYPGSGSIYRQAH